MEDVLPHAWVSISSAPMHMPITELMTRLLGAGYLIGPSVGAACWRLTHRRTMNLIDARDREFHKRIVKNRVDPQMQSATNPVPDFYG